MIEPKDLPIPSPPREPPPLSAQDRVAQLAPGDAPCPLAHPAWATLPLPLSAPLPTGLAVHDLGGSEGALRLALTAQGARPYGLSEDPGAPLVLLIAPSAPLGPEALAPFTQIEGPSSAPRILLVRRGPPSEGTSPLRHPSPHAASRQRTREEEAIGHLALPPHSDPQTEAWAILAALDQMMAPGAIRDYALMGEQLQVATLSPLGALDAQAQPPRPADLAGERPFILGPEGPYAFTPRPPGAQEVRVAVAVVAARGEDPAAQGPDRPNFIGWVDALGAGVDDLNPGACVLGVLPGAPATHVTLPRTTLSPAQGQGSATEMLRDALGAQGAMWPRVSVGRLCRLGAPPRAPHLIGFEDRWAVRLGHRPPSRPLDPWARYILSGVEGPLGEGILRWFERRGARRLIALGRGEPRGGLGAALAQLRARGVEVRYLALDPGTPAGAHLLGEILGDRPAPLGGILHVRHGAALQSRSALALGKLRPREGLWSLTRGPLSPSARAELWGSPERPAPPAGAPRLHLDWAPAADAHPEALAALWAGLDHLPGAPRALIARLPPPADAR